MSTTIQQIITVLAFLAITLGFGSSLRAAGWSRDENLLEKACMSLGVGLFVMPIIGAFFSLVRIPLSYVTFGIAALATFTISRRITPTVATPGGDPSKKPDMPAFATAASVAVMALTAITMYMYMHGSFSYPWLEDGDTWLFASVAKYIAVEKTCIPPLKFTMVALPYPQGFQIILGVLHQLNTSISWTAKFFTCLFISLSIPFFYFCAKRLLRTTGAALFATAALASMPAWLSHFIFAYNLNMVALPVLFYTLLRADENQRWYPVAALVFASIWLIHFYSAFVTTIMFGIYYVIKSFCEDRPNGRIALTAAAGATAAGLLFWIPTTLRYREYTLIGGIGHIGNLWRSLPNYMPALIAISICIIGIIIMTRRFWLPAFGRLIHPDAWPSIKAAFFFSLIALLMIILLQPKKFMPLLGSGSMKYQLNHFFFFKGMGNFIQNPYGIGTIPMFMGLVVFIGLFYTAPRLFVAANRAKALVLAWTIFCFLGVSSAHFSLNIVPFRMWTFFAFSIALLAGICYRDFIVGRFGKGIVTAIITALLVLELANTWYLNKYDFNCTRVWHNQWLGTPYSHELYIWVKKNLPKNSRVYALGVDQFIPIGFDMLSPNWDEEILNYHYRDLEDSPLNNYAFLKKKKFDYLILDPTLLFFRLNYIYPESYTPADKAAAISRDGNLFTAKKEIMKQDANHFEIVKETKNGGVLFKIH